MEEEVKEEEEDNDEEGGSVKNEQIKKETEGFQIQD